MLGLICKSLEGFVRDQHGDLQWERIRRAARLPFERFEALRIYDDAVLMDLVAATGGVLDRRQSPLLEDIGHWICTHRPLEPVRRLIRFSGTSFVDLLFSLEEIEDRARIALPNLHLPQFRVELTASDEFVVTSQWMVPGAAAVLTGMLRAMADDYGTLAIIERGGLSQDGDTVIETISVRVIEDTFHEPREFTLGGVR